MEVSAVYNLLSVTHLLIGFAQDLEALHSAVLEVEMLGESRVPDVAEVRRESIFEETNVSKLAYFVSVDSKSVWMPIIATKVSRVFLCDVLLSIMSDHVAQA